MLGDFAKSEVLRLVQAHLGQLSQLGSWAFSRLLCPTGDQKDQVEAGHQPTEHLAEHFKAPEVT